MFTSPTKGANSVASLEAPIKEAEGDSPIRKYNIRMKNAMAGFTELKITDESADKSNRQMQRLNSLLRANSSYNNKRGSIHKDLANASADSMTSGATTPQRKAHRSATSRTSEALQYSKLMRPEAGLIKKLLMEEKDERYRYLLKQGNLHFIQAETMSLYVELPQIPNILIVYRRPGERELNPEKMCLESRMLSHVPLLEGEERLKSMHLQNNQIGKIENLVSLPNLTFLDFSLNRLKDVASLSSVPQLRVLMLGRNQISRITGLESLVNLDILDLHDNKIARMTGLQNQNKLRVLNLSDNLIIKMEGYQGLSALSELNLRRNQITEIEDNLPPRRAPLGALQKLFLSHNKLSTVMVLGHICPGLVELSLEDNPVDSQDLPKRLVGSVLAKLKTYNFQAVEEIKPAPPPAKEEPAEPVPKVISGAKENTATTTTTTTATKGKHVPAQQVIEVIKREWDKEMARLRERQSGGAKGEKSHVHSGHAEIEGNHALYIYGNALEVLGRSEFYSQVDEIQFNYVRFDLLVYHVNLEKLKKFHRLRKLYFQHNNLTSLIFLSKLESLQSLRSLTILDNEILSTATLRSFVVYRFQSLEEFNGTPITERDRKIAKQQFQLFDKILSISNVLTQKPVFADATAKQEYRQRAKKHQEFAANWTDSLITNAVDGERTRAFDNFDLNLDRALRVIAYAQLENIQPQPHWYEPQMASLERPMLRALTK